MKKKLVLPIILATSIAMLTGCAERYEEKHVQAVVVEKDYDKATKKWDKKKKKWYNKKEEYEVVLQYEDIEKEFEFSDSSFYNKYNVGDSVKVVLVQGFDEENNIVSQDIELSRSY